MAMRRPLNFLFLVIVAALSSFTVVTCAEDVVTAEEPSNSQEDSKEKRSQEEILFGNQQNKPNGLVDDLMSMAEDNATTAAEEKKTSAEEDVDEDNWYNTLPASPPALRYSQGLKTLPPATGFYEQYRRKRQLLEHPLPLRKRSLRSSLGQMIQKRGIRIPRRSMRLKRQVDVEDLLNMFGNDRYYNEEAQVTPHSFSGRARTLSKRHVPGRFSGYQVSAAPYPYVFQHTDDGVLSSGNEGEDNNEAVDDLMLLPPNSRYIDTAQDILPFRSREEENDGMQQWLSRHTVPSVFRVSRRSSPFFYPIDYRYIPGYKKRSSGNEGRFSDDESDFGKWGHVVQVPEAYASADDIARLYALSGLAELLSEGEMRPSS